MKNTPFREGQQKVLLLNYRTAQNVFVHFYLFRGQQCPSLPSFLNFRTLVPTVHADLLPGVWGGLPTSKRANCRLSTPRSDGGPPVRMTEPSWNAAPRCLVPDVHPVAGPARSSSLPLPPPPTGPDFQSRGLSSS